jgi:hypothetical protein
MKYNSNSEPMEMSYFRLNLLSYLRDTHPDKANNFFFIAGRGDMVAEACSKYHISIFLSILYLNRIIQFF